MGTDKMRGYAFGALGLVAVVAVWWLLKLTVFSDKLIPTPAGVVSGLLDDGFTFYGNNFSGTIEEALRGFAYGNVAALLMASLVLLAPALEQVITQIAIISYCIPLVAITPILYVVLGGSEGPGDPSPTAVVLAAISCFFTTLVGAVLGFRSADTTSLDVVSVYGGSRLAQLRKVQLVSALPAILSALQIAAPAAFLGAVLGEYIGGSTGVAPALINAAQNLNDERAWGLMLVSGLVAGVGYGFFSLLARFVTPWAKGDRVMSEMVNPVENRTSVQRQVALRAVGAGVARALFNGVVTVLIVLAVWVLFLRLLDVSEFVGKGPTDVWAYLFTDDDAAENLSAVVDLTQTTLRDALIGFVAGMGAALLLAASIVLSRPAENTIMPVAMLMRSVPLIAMAPVIRLIFGDGIATIAVIAGIVVLFPALVSIVFGLRSTSAQMHDLVAVYGGSKLTALVKVDLPSALPAFFAAVRISVPGAITGALIAEWLGGSGAGVGYGVVSALGRAQNTLVWSLVIVITLVSLVLYTVAQIVESVVLARFGRTAGRT